MEKGIFLEGESTDELLWTFVGRYRVRSLPVRTHTYVNMSKRKGCKWTDMVDKPFHSKETTS